MVGFLADLGGSVGAALKSITVETLYKGFQIDEENPLVGAEARVEILQRLGQSLLDNQDIFGPSGRPGLLVGITPCYPLSPVPELTK
jgi:hypothetical protein